MTTEEKVGYILDRIPMAWEDEIDQVYELLLELENKE